MKFEYQIVIPARLASQRLPGKPLIRIGRRTLIEHVYRRALEASAQSVVIATDSSEILEAATGFGCKAVLTSTEHESGSDRVAECADIMGWPDDTLIVNLQGDEPLMPARCLEQSAALLQENPGADVSSLYWPIDCAETIQDSNVVKVVCDLSGYALYFSRSVIPYPRGTTVDDGIRAGAGWNRHIGLYAYRASALRAFTTMKPSPLERLERLEQLRFLETGRHIVMARACEFIPAGVDTPGDLERVGNLLAGSA